jgi:hypothetical protein
MVPVMFSFLVAGLLFLAWKLLDPHFVPRSYLYGRGSGKGALLVLLLAVLPVWVRVPFVLSVVGYYIRLGFHQLRHAFDKAPDFVIGPDGISGLDELGYCSIPWSDVSSIDVRLFAIRIYGPERRIHWSLRLIVGQRVMFLYSRAFFKTPRSEVLAAIKHYRPELMT